MQNQDENQQAAAQPVPAAAAASAPVEEEKKGEEETKEVFELAPGEDLSKVFVNLDEGVPSDIIESLCMECQEQGETRFMYTKIPMFKEIIVSSFCCDACGHRNNEVQFGGKLGFHGCKYTLVVNTEEDLNRSVVKSEAATIKIPELDFEIPPETQKGSIKTIEGYLLSTIEGIEELQEERRKFNPQVAAQIDVFLVKIKACREGQNFPFTFELIDPSGNSFVQNPNAPNPDIGCIHEEFLRTVEHYQTMGYNVDEATKAIEEDRAKHAEDQATPELIPAGKNKAMKTTAAEQEALLAKMQALAEKTKQQAYAQKNPEPEITANAIDFSKPIDEQGATAAEVGDNRKELITFPAPCPGCFNPGEVRMCCATIPYFKEIIIMAYSCDVCGHKSTEIKQGGGISEKATKITFSVHNVTDMNRDIFKSDTCFVSIPELDIELQPGTLGSVYTTVEGLMVKMQEQMEEINPFGQGDSAKDGKFKALVSRIQAMSSGEQPFTIIMDDPLANCFIYNPNAPEDDPQIVIEVYDRTEEQNEDLGITDMKV